MKNRIPAFLIHLLLSGVVALIAVIIVFFVWYPSPLHDAVGVTKIFLILLSVNLVIGPMLTLLVYKPDKPSLKFDLTVIAVLQIAALSYGVTKVFQGRPAFIVFAKDRFNIARASDIDPDSAKKALLSNNQAAIAGLGSPRWVAAVAANDAKRDQEILFSSLQGGPDWPLLPELFVPLAQVKAQVLEKAKPLPELRKLHNRYPASLEALAKWKNNEVKWLPLRGKTKDMVVLVDASSAAIIKVLDIKPWL